MLQKLFNIEAEQAVLGAILFDPQCAELVARLKASDFSVPEHCEIFAWIEKDVHAGRKPTPMSIISTLGAMKVGPIDGATYVVRLGSAHDRMTARENLALVKAMSARRMIECVGDVLKEQARDAGQSPRDVSLGAIQALNDAVAAERRDFTKPQMIHEAVRELVDTLDDPDDGSLISTGLKSLDRFMGGWPRGELSILAGRPSMGKSALVAALARRAAMSGVNMMMFSLEMPKKALAARMISDCAYSSREDMRVPYADILRKNLSSFQKQRLAAAIDDFTGYPLKIDDQRGLTMPEIQMRAMRYADELDRKGERLDVIVVDHLGKIRASDRYSGNVTAETGEKSDALMTMSYELNAAVVAAHQLNRNTEGREDKHPTPADLRNSGDLEQDAHTLIFPYRQSYYLERQKLEDPEKDRIRLATLEKKKNLLEILVSKCRNGACGTVEVFADMPSNHVEDLMQ